MSAEDESVSPVPGRRHRARPTGWQRTTDATRTNQALDVPPEARTYRQFVEVAGLGHQIEDDKEITVPAYQGSPLMAGTSASGGTA